MPRSELIQRDFSKGRHEVLLYVDFVAGQYLDIESGFYYLRARYYEPSTGQFISKDPAANRTMEPYGYVMDSPLNRTDSSGLDGYCGFNSTYYQTLRFTIKINCYVISGRVTFNFSPVGPGATDRYRYWYQVLSPGELKNFSYTSPKTGAGFAANASTTSPPRQCEVGTWGAATIHRAELVCEYLQRKGLRLYGIG